MATADPASPVPRKAAAQFDIHHDAGLKGSSSRSSSIHGSTGFNMVMPLTTSKTNNHQSPLASLSSSYRQKVDPFVKEQENESPIDKLLKHISLQKDNPQANASPTRNTKPTLNVNDEQSLDKNLSKLSLNTRKMPEQQTDVDVLKKQLEDAQVQIARMDLELSQQRSTQYTIDQALGSPLVHNAQTGDVTQQLLSKLDSAPPGLGPSNYNSEARAGHRGGPSPKPWETYQGPWNDGGAPPSMNPSSTVHQPEQPFGWGNDTTHDLGPDPYHRPLVGPQPQRSFGNRFNGFPSGPAHLSLGIGSGPQDSGYRGAGPQYGRWPPARSGWDSYPANARAPHEFSPPITPISLTFGNPGPAVASYPPRAFGTSLSPTAAEFKVDHPVGNGNMASNPWNATSESVHPNAQHYMPPIEPINYRRLLDRNTTCNWSYIVEKIVCSNDQQASIFLQQKLKISSPEQKFELVEAIIAKAYPLMINRFGNFLIQRCFEHGTPEQVVSIANAIRGKTLELSMDAFGCHVVQKAFDVVPEHYKAIMVHELLRRIPETVVHRYACHVWQKLFELRWSDSPPQIMKYVNEALCGMWHEVALGETGSLVVQNIFENCLEEDKRPCIGEVLANIDIVSHGQFGNWCVQHICEHGAPADKSRAIEHVLHYATEYSTDQFASKVVEKCLKVGGPDFLDRYLDKVCEGRPDRPRMPLIDIAGDQYGNYLVQFILINADPHHRETVSQHVRKHMVSLRGSKFGSRVAMLCTNPTFQTRPGPPMALPLNSHERFYHHNTNNMPMNAQPMGSNMPRHGFR